MAEGPVLAQAGHSSSQPFVGRPGEIAHALIAEKAPTATRDQAIDIQAAILAAPGKRDGETVIGEGSPTRWELKGRCPKG
jgi:hypothetical protein